MIWAGRFTTLGCRSIKSLPPLLMLQTQLGFVLFPRQELALNPTAPLSSTQSWSIALCCRNATTALKSLLCRRTEQIKEDGMRALHASLSTTEREELKDTRDTRCTSNLFSLQITRCLIFTLSGHRLNLALFIQIKTLLKTRLEIQRQWQNWILTVPGEIRTT